MKRGRALLDSPQSGESRFLDSLRSRGMTEGELRSLGMTEGELRSLGMTEGKLRSFGMTASRFFPPPVTPCARAWCNTRSNNDLRSRK